MSNSLQHGIGLPGRGDLAARFLAVVVERLDGFKKRVQQQAQIVQDCAQRLGFPHLASNLIWWTSRKHGT
jgi:hypothetical protein